MSNTPTLAQRRLLKTLERLAAKEQPRIYVSVADHETLYLYFDAQWEVRPVPGRRDQLRINGIPIIWRESYTGAPTLVDPAPGEGVNA